MRKNGELSNGQKLEFDTIKMQLEHLKKEPNEQMR